MKKLASILAIVLAFTMMMSLTSFAAAEFKLADDAVIPEGTTVTPAADSIAVTTAATAGNYYGVLLVEGNALPTVDNAILYIDQATAADVAQAFSVLPIIPEVGTELTLYISSNVAGADLIAIPLVYGEEVVEPVGPAVTLMNGAETVAAELVTDADGNVTLPADVAFNKTANAGYTFTLYSWITADGAAEYTAGTKVAAADLEGKILYAKYTVNILHGDTDGKNGINATDRTYIHQYVANGRALGSVSKTFTEVVGVEGMPEFTVGDVDAKNGINATDRTYVHQFVANGRSLGNIGADVYYVNK